jgi:hypothetical protein
MEDTYPPVCRVHGGVGDFDHDLVFSGVGNGSWPNFHSFGLLFWQPCCFVVCDLSHYEAVLRCFEMVEVGRGVYERGMIVDLPFAMAPTLYTVQNSPYSSVHIDYELHNNTQINNVQGLQRRESVVAKLCKSGRATISCRGYTTPQFILFRDNARPYIIPREHFLVSLGNIVVLIKPQRTSVAASTRGCQN